MQDFQAMEKKSHAAFFTQCLILTRRSFVNMYREVGYYWLRLLIYGALALSLGTMFYDIGLNSGSIQVREKENEAEYGLSCSNLNINDFMLYVKLILKPSFDGFRPELHCLCLLLHSSPSSPLVDTLRLWRT